MFKFETSKANDILKSISLLFSTNNNYDKVLRYKTLEEEVVLKYNRDVCDIVLTVKNRFSTEGNITFFKYLYGENKKGSDLPDHIKKIFLWNPTEYKELKENYKYCTTSNTEFLISQLN